MQTRSSPSIATLHSLARQAAIPDFDRLSKSDLYKLLQSRCNIERLSRIEARRRAASASSLKETSKKRLRPINESTRDVKSEHTKRHKYDSVVAMKRSESMELNKIDPIMLEPIRANPFKFFRPNGSCVQFNADTLADYMLTTGDFSDPETRIPFSDSDLKTIDLLVKNAGGVKKSIFESKKQPNMFAEMKFRRDALLGLERYAGESIAEMLGLIEGEAGDDAEMHLLLNVLPTFADIFKQLKDADSEYASQCLSHWVSFVRGPPNRPTNDYFGIKPMIINFLEGCGR